MLEIEQDEVVVRKGDQGLPGSKIYVANRIAATQSLSSKFLGSFHLQSKNAAGEIVQKLRHRLLDWSFDALILMFPVIWYYIFGSWFVRLASIAVGDHWSF